MKIYKKLKIYIIWKYIFYKKNILSISCIYFFIFIWLWSTLQHCKIFLYTGTTENICKIYNELINPHKSLFSKKRQTHSEWDLKSMSIEYCSILQGKPGSHWLCGPKPLSTHSTQALCRSKVYTIHRLTIQTHCLSEQKTLNAFTQHFL